MTNPDTPDAPSRSTRKASSATSWAQLSAEFVAFATKHLDTEDASDIAGNLESTFIELRPDERKQVMSKIREIVPAEAELRSLEEQINASDDAEASSAIWAQMESKSAELAALISELDELWNERPKDDSTFGYLLQQRAAQAKDLKRDAGVLGSSNPISTAGGAALFEAGMAHLAIKSERQRYIYGSRIEWLRVLLLQASRDNRYKATGLVKGPLRQPDSTWRPIQSMAGGMGKIQVWAKDDGQGRIMDRIVLKATHLRQELWDTASSWYGTGADRVPIEVYVHSQMSGRGDHIVQLTSQGAQIDPARRTFRMWLEYCPNGDLFEVVKRHRDAWLAIPMEFVLYVFKAMVEACLIMEQGAVSGEQDGWEQIVHRDLKPENVFLGLSRANFNNYPEPKMADFGLAIVTDLDDPANPDLYNDGAGTQGYLAPEQLRIIDTWDGEATDNFQLLAPCNVWGIGLIILDMLECMTKSYRTQPDYRSRSTYFTNMAVRDAYAGTDAIWGPEPHPHADVFDMVDRCLKYEPKERPSPEELRIWLAEKMVPINTWLDTLGEAGDPHYAIVPKEHPHHLGMALEDLVVLEPTGPSFYSSSNVDGGAPQGGGGGGGGGLRIVNAAPGDFSFPKPSLSGSAAAFLASLPDE